MYLVPATRPIEVSVPESTCAWHGRWAATLQRAIVPFWATTMLGCTPSDCPLAPRKQPFSSGPGLNPGRADRCKKSVQMSELVVLGLVSPAGQHHTGPPAVTAYKCTNAAAVAAPLWLAALVLD